MTTRAKPASIDAYVALFPPETRGVLEKVRATIRKAAPTAEERISYRIPAFATGSRVFIFFAAFKHHIGLYPPVRGNAKLRKEAARYAGEKGNLRFPLDEPIPYGLIGRIAKAHLRQAKALQE